MTSGALGGIVWIIALILMGLAICFKWGPRPPEKAWLWAGAASKLNGSYDRMAEEIRFVLLDRPALLAEEREAEGEGVATVVEVDLGGISPGRLEIHPAGLASWIARLLGAPPLAVGDPDFDSRFVVSSEPEGPASRLFNPERRAATLRALREASVASVGLARGCLRLKVESEATTEQDILVLARAALVLAEGLLGAKETVLTLNPMEFRPPLGQCLVCRGLLRERVVLCGRCRTPHHEECWRLVRRCSIYGCDEDRFITPRAAGR